MALFKKKLRVVVLVSGRGSNMKAIAKACNSGSIRAKLVMVVSDNKDAQALDYCKQNKIPAKYISPGKFKTKLEGEAEADYIRVIEKARPDLVVLAGFMRVIKPPFIRAFKNKIINIHPSLLPKYPGLHTHKRALESGDPESGCTVHFVNEVVDGGKRIMQARVPIEKGDTEDTLAAKILKREHLMLPMVIGMFADGKIDYDSFPFEPIPFKDSKNL